MATNNLAVPKELYALRKQKNDDDITLLFGKIAATRPPLKKIGYSGIFLAALSNRAIFSTRMHFGKSEEEEGGQCFFFEHLVLLPLLAYQACASMSNTWSF